jgi:hypothetical protein
MIFFSTLIKNEWILRLVIQGAAAFLTGTGANNVIRTVLLLKNSFLFRHRLNGLKLLTALSVVVLQTIGYEA